MSSEGSSWAVFKMRNLIIMSKKFMFRVYLKGLENQGKVKYNKKNSFKIQS